MNDNSIAWIRVAEPQADGYDSKVAISLAVQNNFEALPHPKENVPFGEGMIAITPDPILNGFEGCRSVSLTHPNIHIAERLLRYWPVGYRQCQVILHSIGVAECDSLGEDQVVGSICGAGSYGFGSIAVTVNHHMGLAEGIVHEMAHHKLRALGVEFTSAKRLVMNPNTIEYRSPIRYDCLRPMTAVLHAQYSYMYIVALDCAVVENDRDNDYRRDIILRNSIAIIIPKLEFGFEILQKYWARDADGEEFSKGFFSWCDRIIQNGTQLLSQYNIPVKPFKHPLG